MSGARHILILCFAALASVRAIEVTLREDAAVQDGTGVVWSLGNVTDNGRVEYDHLLSTNGVSWRVIACPGANVKTHPEGLGLRRDGSVLCVWRPADDRKVAIVTRHRGEVSERLTEMPLGEGPAFLAAPSFFEDSRGNVWLTESGERIYRIGPDGTAERACMVEDAQRHALPGKDEFNAGVVKAFEDTKGRVWFLATSGSVCHRLRGVLIHEEGKFTHHPQIHGVPAKPFRAFHFSENHLWLAVHGEGVFDVDCSTMRAVPEGGGKLRDVQALFSAGGTVHAIACPEVDWEISASGKPYEAPTSTLWRREGDGWKKIAGSMGFVSAPLETPDGIFLREYVSVLQFIPKVGTATGHPALRDGAIRLDWQRGFKLPRQPELFHMPDGRTLILGFGWLPEDFLARAREVRPAVEKFSTWLPMVRTGDGGLWYVPADRRDILLGNRGQGWKSYPFPKGISPDRLSGLGTDSLHRVWLLPDDQERAAAIFDPAKERWTVFAGYEHALRAQLPLPAGFRLDARNAKPVFSKDGRIAFSNPGNKIHYFDGRKWRAWANLAVWREGFPGVPTLSPYFDHEGVLCWAVRDFGQPTVHGWTPAKGWHDRNQSWNASPQPEDGRRSQPPPGSTRRAPEAIVYDNHGSAWMLIEKRLYRALPGISVPVFGPDAPEQFPDPFLAGAFVANDGEIYIATASSGREEYLHLPPPQPLATVMVLHRPAEDGVRVDMSSPSATARFFVWRLDGGPWSPPARRQTFDLTQLPGGEHVIEAAAMDELLRPDMTPASARFRVALDPDRQVADLIGDLKNADFACRESAIAALVRHKTRAAAAIARARAGANEDFAWWLDAAKQELDSGLRGDRFQILAR